MKQSHTLRSSTPNEVRKQQLRRQIWQSQRDAHTRTEEEKISTPTRQDAELQRLGHYSLAFPGGHLLPGVVGAWQACPHCGLKLPRHEPGARVYIPGGIYLFLPLTPSFAFEKPSPKIEGRCKELIWERSSLPCER